MKEKPLTKRRNGFLNQVFCKIGRKSCQIEETKSKKSRNNTFNAVGEYVTGCSHWSVQVFIKKGVNYTSFSGLY